MTAFRLLSSSLLMCGAISLTAPALAEQVAREQDIVGLRLGQRVMVDDGTCPAGQVKEVLGAKMMSNGISRTRTCVPRFGPKKK
ncbi:MAG: hypothetical protein HY852_13620 [Bradyrhizobium sp.]|uniref:DUF6719 family protein n=1 Tax=Bradyrhizobium sp. TaxID=376 RepID=UPI0025BB75C6|nr:DUF6719 family protein [Bradyrhizobium sp.]MBI5262846.1 hypothetical protein [Bradyrhizobium sp.]